MFTPSRQFLVISAALLSACATLNAPPASSLTMEALRELPTQHYTLAPEGAVVEFTAKPVGLPNVRGNFEHFGGTVAIVDAGNDRIDIDAAVNLASVETGNRGYNHMLMSEAWFDVERHPEARFQGSLAGFEGEGLGRVEGTITIKGVTRPAVLEVKLGCDGLNQCPHHEVGFNGQVTVSRSDFGMTGLRGVVRDEVQLSFRGVLGTP